MGLDLYVGSLTRYYAGKWETTVERWGRERGIPVAVIRQSDVAVGVADPRRVRDSVLDWRATVDRRLRARTHTPAPIPGLESWHPIYLREKEAGWSRPLDWDESDESPYFTDKPDWYGYVALLLLAAYAEHPEIARPRQLPETWSHDPAWRVCARDGFQHSRYQQILQPELWLPVDFDFTFEADDPARQSIAIGSTVSLLAQLHDLDKRALGGTAADFPVGQAFEAEPGEGLENLARYALAIFLHLAETSLRHRLPMKLDY